MAPSVDGKSAPSSSVSMKELTLIEHPINPYAVLKHGKVKTAYTNAYEGYLRGLAPDGTFTRRYRRKLTPEGVAYGRFTTSEEAQGFPTYSWLNCPKNIKPYLFMGGLECDMENCHLHVFAYLARCAGAKIPNVQAYIDHRDAWLDKLGLDSKRVEAVNLKMGQQETTRKIAKTYFLAALNGQGNRDFWDKYGDYFVNRVLPPEYTQFKRDLKAAKCNILLHASAMPYSDVLQHVKKTAGGNAWLGLYLQHVETELFLECHSYVAAHCREHRMATYNCDGFVLQPMDPTVGGADTSCDALAQSLQAHVLKYFNICMPFTVEYIRSPDPLLPLVAPFHLKPPPKSKGPFTQKGPKAKALADYTQHCKAGVRHKVVSLCDEQNVYSYTTIPASALFGRLAAAPGYYSEVIVEKEPVRLFFDIEFYLPEGADLCTYVEADRASDLCLLTHTIRQVVQDIWGKAGLAHLDTTRLLDCSRTVPGGKQKVSYHLVYPRFVLLNSEQRSHVTETVREAVVERMSTGSGLATCIDNSWNCMRIVGCHKPGDPSSKGRLYHAWDAAVPIEDDVWPPGLCADLLVQPLEASTPPLFSCYEEPADTDESTLFPVHPLTRISAQTKDLPAGALDWLQQQEQLLLQRGLYEALVRQKSSGAVRAMDKGICVRYINKDCRIKGGSHRSNNIKLSYYYCTGQIVQTCFSQQCSGERYLVARVTPFEGYATTSALGPLAYLVPASHWDWLFESPRFNNAKYKTTATKRLQGTVLNTLDRAKHPFTYVKAFDDVDVLARWVGERLIAFRMYAPVALERMLETLNNRIREIRLVKGKKPKRQNDLAIGTVLDRHLYLMATLWRYFPDAVDALTWSASIAFCPDFVIPEHLFTALKTAWVAALRTSLYSCILLFDVMCVCLDNGGHFARVKAFYTGLDSLLCESPDTSLFVSDVHAGISRAWYTLFCHPRPTCATDTRCHRFDPYLSLPSTADPDEATVKFAFATLSTDSQSHASSQAIQANQEAQSALDQARMAVHDAKEALARAKLDVREVGTHCPPLSPGSKRMRAKKVLECKTLLAAAEATLDKTTIATTPSSPARPMRPSSDRQEITTETVTRVQQEVCPDRAHQSRMYLYTNLSLVHPSWWEDSVSTARIFAYAHATHPLFGRSVAAVAYLRCGLPAMGTQSLSFFVDPRTLDAESMATVVAKLERLDTAFLGVYTYGPTYKTLKYLVEERKGPKSRVDVCTKVEDAVPALKVNQCPKTSEQRIRPADILSVEKAVWTDPSRSLEDRRAIATALVDDPSRSLEDQIAIAAALVDDDDDDDDVAGPSAPRTSSVRPSSPPPAQAQVKTAESTPQKRPRSPSADRGAESATRSGPTSVAKPKPTPLVVEIKAKPKPKPKSKSTPLVVEVNSKPKPVSKPPPKKMSRLKAILTQSFLEDEAVETSDDDDEDDEDNEDDEEDERIQAKRTLFKKSKKKEEDREDEISHHDEEEEEEEEDLDTYDEGDGFIDDYDYPDVIVEEEEELDVKKKKSESRKRKRQEHVDREIEEGRKELMRINEEIERAKRIIEETERAKRINEETERAKRINEETERAKSFKPARRRRILLDSDEEDD